MICADKHISLAGGGRLDGEVVCFPKQISVACLAPIQYSLYRMHPLRSDDLRPLRNRCRKCIYLKPKLQKLFQEEFPQ